MLNPIQEFKKLIEKKYNTEINAKTTLRVLSCLQYIENNFSKITKTCSKSSRNRSSIIRVAKGLSFYIGYIKNQTEARIYFATLLNQVKLTLRFLLEKKESIYIKVFMRNIRQSDIGCMEARFEFALLYVGMLKSNGGILPLDKLMKNFHIKVSNKQQDLTVFKSTLDHFAHYVNIQYPVSINGENVPISWPIIKRYLKDALYCDIESWQNLLTVLEEPINIKNISQRKQEWVLFYFNTERAANLYLNFVKSVLPDVFQTELNQARVIQTKNGYRFRLTQKQFLTFSDIQTQTNGKISREQIENLNTPPERYVVKTLRADEKCFVHFFSTGITRSEKLNWKIPLRKEPKKKYTVDTNGVHERINKKSTYTEEQKKGFSPYQSTTFVSSEIRPPVFGFKRTEENKLVGIIVNIKDALLGRLFIYDGGTINRPYDFKTVKEAEKYYKQKANKSLFADIDKFEKVLKTPKNKEKLNEVLARLRWNTDGSSAICIFSNTLEARLLAQEYARILRSQLRAQFQENSKPWDAKYLMPICFYSRNKDHDFFNQQLYTSEKQLQDIEKGEKIFKDQAKREKYLKKTNFEFLLALKDSHAAFTTTYQGKPLVFQLMKTGYLHILEALIQKDSQPDQTKKLLAKSIDKLENFISKYYGRPSLITLTWLKKLGVDLNFREPNFGYTALITAARKNHIEVVRNLLRMGVNNSGIALRHASTFGHTEIVRVLLNAGANINLRNNLGGTALMLAARYGNTETARVLLDAGANINLRNNSGKTAYDWINDQSLKNLLYPAKLKLHLYCKGRNRVFNPSEAKLKAAQALIALINGDNVNLKPHQPAFENGMLKEIYEKMLLHDKYRTVIERSLNVLESSFGAMQDAT